MTLGCALLGACDEPQGADPTPTPSATTPRAGEPGEGQPGDDSSDFDFDFDVVTNPRQRWCPRDRLIARVGPGACVGKSNLKGDWSAVKLFADGTPPLVGAGEPPGHLARYCQYTWTAAGDGQAAPDMSLLDGIDTAARDCEVVWQQSDPLSKALSPALSATYLDHLDAPAKLTGVRRPVTVAVIDSLSSINADGRSAHGESMGALIDDVQCPGKATCASSVHYRLALPRYLDEHHATQIDWVSGGNFGSHGELAKAIFGAVREWETHGSVGHLILNLSVGWEPSFGGDEANPADMPPPVRAVFDALQYASCQGALIVAAAGNASGSCETGPMAPALWEEHLAPNATTCQNLGAGPRPAYNTSDRLVYAAAGLRHDGRLLASTRTGGLSRLTAPAFAAVNAVDGSLHIPMTGSSLAAASVSAVASLVWSYEDTLAPAAVIKRLYDSGAAGPVTTLAEFGVTDVPRRVSACKALAACVPTPTQSCAGVVCDELPPDLTGLATAANNAFTTVVAGAANPMDVDRRGTFSAHPECTDACGESITVWTTSADPGPPACEHDWVVGLDRSTSPQPKSSSCHACFISDGPTDDTAYLVLGDEYDGSTIVAAALEVTTDFKHERIELGALSLSSKDPLRVLLPPSSIGLTSMVTLHITYADGDTQSNELRVQ